MKKILFLQVVFLLFILPVGVIHAESLDEEQARYAAAEFFSPSSQSSRLRAKGRQLVLRSQGHEDGYYIFDRPEGGVVFVADDDAIGRTVLGYTDQGNFDADNLPVALQDWLDQVGVLMSAVHEGKISKTNVQRKAGSIVVDALIQTRWAQSAPYNNLCPLLNGERCITGCVATAMAQVMKYWKWPNHGYGSVSYYDELGCGQMLSRDLSSDYYDWDNMLNNYLYDYTNTQATAVASLMRDCGYAVQMKYTPTASGANLSNCARALCNNFHYSSEAKIMLAGNYFEESWHEYIRQDLNAGRPVLYRGEYEEAEAGHAFILDGYDTGGYYHVNWGWGGSQDGWFILTNLNGYNSNQGMINNLKPDYDDGEDINNIQINGIFYSLDTNNRTAKVIENPNGYSGAVNIPESITYGKNYSVTSIGVEAFFGCSNLITITIPKTITSIGKDAFSGCTGLTSVHITDLAAWCKIDFCSTEFLERTNTLIWEFDYQRAQPLVYAHNLYLNGQKIKDLVIPNGVTSISRSAFDGCTSITSVTIPESVKSIGGAAFHDCTGLTAVHIRDISAWCNIDFSYYYYYSEVREEALCDNERSRISTIWKDAQPLVYAHNLYLNGQKIKDLVIPNGVTGISRSAFNGCTSITSVTIPNSVTSIGSDAFSETTWYNNQPNGVVYAGKVAYNYKGTMPSGTQVILKEGTLGITDHAFEKCSGLTSITIPNSVNSIDEYAFSWCNGLRSVIIPNSVTYIGNDAFHGSGLTSVTIGNSVTSIGERAFYDCSGLTSVTIPSSVTYIGKEAFYCCCNLTDVYCLAENIPSTQSWAFGDWDDRIYFATATLHVPAGSIHAYSTTAPWSDFGTIVAIEDSPNIDFADANVKAICVSNWDTNYDGRLSQAEAAAVTSIGKVFKSHKNITSFNELQYFTGLTSIGVYAFEDCSGLTSVTIPNSVTSIGSYAFSFCSGLKSITIPNSVTSIGSGAFELCSGLTSVTIPNSVTSIGYLAFYGCSGLTSITIPNSVTSISSSAFYNCSGLTSVTIPNSVTSIGGYAFSGCSGLTSIKVEAGNTKYDSRNNCNAIIETATNTLIVGCKNTVIPNGVTSIGNSAFYGCSGLTSITIPNSVTSIGESAFSGCSGLTSITIPNSVTSIGKYAFDKCNDLTSINMPEGVTSIGWGAFAECQGLTNITIPNSVTSIDKEAFFNCNNLTFVKVENALPAEIYDNTFTNRSNAVLLVPAGSIASYQAADYWRDFKKIVDYIAEGDVNVDDGIDVLDVVDIARFVVGNPATILSGKSSDDT